MRGNGSWSFFSSGPWTELSSEKMGKKENKKKPAGIKKKNRRI